MLGAKIRYHNIPRYYEDNEDSAECILMKVVLFLNRKMKISMYLKNPREALYNSI